MSSTHHQYWMNKAIEVAKKGNTPFGALLVNNQKAYIEAYNTTKLDGPVAHAEINVIQKMSTLNFGKPMELTLYTTVEPCPMCISAIVWAGIGQVVYGASIADASQFGHQIHITSKEVIEKSWRQISLIGGVNQEHCLQLFKK